MRAKEAQTRQAAGPFDAVIVVEGRAPGRLEREMPRHPAESAGDMAVLFILAAVPGRAARFQNLPPLVELHPGNEQAAEACRGHRQANVAPLAVVVAAVLLLGADIEFADRLPHRSADLGPGGLPRVQAQESVL